MSPHRSPSDARSIDSELPPIDERLVTPETRYEMWNGELVVVSPADHAHGELHSQVLALVQASVAPGFTVVCDVLTRTSKRSDFAPDVAVVPSARDPVTGQRQIAELAFEIVSTVSLGETGERAAELVRRGMRRVFALDVKRECALEWQAELDTWRIIDGGGAIVDPALAVPLPIAKLVRAGKADEAMARALIQKRTPAIEEIRAQDRAAGLAEGKQQGLAEGKQQGLAEGKQQGLAEGKQQGLVEGKQQGLAEAILMALDNRGVALTRRERETIAGEADPQRLRRWFQRAMTCASASELFAEP